MSNKALIEELVGFYNHCMATEQGQVAELIDKAIAALEAQEWVSVEDRLPESNTIVLGWGSHHWPWVVEMESEPNEWYDSSDGNGVVGVTHWKPLPEPPEDETGE